MTRRAPSDGGLRPLLRRHLPRVHWTTVESGALAPGTPVVFLGAWCGPGRDPRGRTVSLVHVVLLDGPPPAPRADDDAADAAWLDTDEPRELAFDHADILAAALHWLRDGSRPDQTR